MVECGLQIGDQICRRSSPTLRRRAYRAAIVLRAAGRRILGRDDAAARSPSWAECEEVESVDECILETLEPVGQENENTPLAPLKSRFQIA